MKYDSLFDYNNDLSRFYLDKKFRLLNTKTEEIIIPAIYDSIGIDFGGFTDVEKDKQNAFFNNEGKQLTPFKYTFVPNAGLPKDVLAGSIIAKAGKKWFKIDKFGNEESYKMITYKPKLNKYGEEISISEKEDVNDYANMKIVKNIKSLGSKNSKWYSCLLINNKKYQPVELFFGTEDAQGEMGMEYHDSNNGDLSSSVIVSWAGEKVFKKDFDDMSQYSCGGEGVIVYGSLEKINSEWKWIPDELSVDYYPEFQEPKKLLTYFKKYVEISKNEIETLFNNLNIKYEKIV